MAYKNDDTVVLAWKDKRPVLMCSSYHGDDMQEIERNKEGGRKEKIQKPVMICDYNKHMGGVDTADHYGASYKFARKSVKWWRKLFFWYLEVCFFLSFFFFAIILLSGVIIMHIS